MDIRKEEERRDFLALSPIERLRMMHARFQQFIALKARGENVSEYEIYRRYLNNNPRNRRRTPRQIDIVLIGGVAAVLHGVKRRFFALTPPTHTTRTGSTLQALSACSCL